MTAEKTKKAADKVKEQQVTYEIYAEMPDDGNRYEVIDGMLELMSPSPTASHQSITLDIGFELKQSCKSDYLIYIAPLDVILSNTNIVQPDALMIHRSRKHIVTSRGIEGPPDLAVEVLSPSFLRGQPAFRRCAAVAGEASALQQRLPPNDPHRKKLAGIAQHAPHKLD